MQSKPNFNAEDVALMDIVCDEAWQEIQTSMFFPTPADSESVRRSLAERVMMAVSKGERDPERLTAIAISGVQGMVSIPL